MLSPTSETSKHPGPQDHAHLIPWVMLVLAALQTIAALRQGGLL